jgi:cell division protein FtsB
MLPQNSSMPMPPLDMKQPNKKIKDEVGDLKTERADKELIIWEAFKQRLGKTEYRDILFDLPSFICPT